jgi:hypothetical protein
MTRGDRAARRSTFTRDEAALRVLLNPGGACADAPADEFDCLVHHVLSVLYREPSIEAVSAVLARECSDHLALICSASAVDSVARRILAWWAECEH